MAHFGVKLGSRGSGLARASFGLKLKVWMSVNGFSYSSFVDMLGTAVGSREVDRIYFVLIYFLLNILSQKLLVFRT